MIDLDRLVLRDRFTEGLALLGIAHGLLQAGGHQVGGHVKDLDGVADKIGGRQVAVTVVGRLSRQPPRDLAVKPEVERIHHQIVPAPCVDGEYRVIDATRGVTLNCPGKSLEE